nr:hypothetical protein [Tanacetum cinerariifolium]
MFQGWNWLESGQNDGDLAQELEDQAVQLIIFAMFNVISQVTANLIAMQRNHVGHLVNLPHGCGCQTTLGMENIQIRNQSETQETSMIKDGGKKKFKSQQKEEVWVNPNGGEKAKKGTSKNQKYTRRFPKCANCKFYHVGQCPRCGWCNQISQKVRTGPYKLWLEGHRTQCF